MKKQELWEKYEEVSVLNESDHPSTILARERIGRRFVIIKELDQKHMEIYNKLKGLSHPNLVKIYECVELDSTSYVIEEFIQGQTLEDLIAQNGPMEEKRAVDCIGQLCDGLELIHREGIIHRDITPSNVLLSNDGIIKLIDFGISRVHREEARQDTTIMGTPGFAAPELFGYTQTDQRADIFAVGVLLNWLLTGGMPNEDIYRKNASVTKVIQKCIIVDKSQRYGSVKKIRSALGITPTVKKARKHIPFHLRQIPGFRTKRVWKMLVALYVYMTFVMMFFCLPQIEPLYGKVIVLLTGFWLLFSFLLLCNFADVDDRLLGNVPKGIKQVVKLMVIAGAFIINIVIAYIVAKLTGM